MINTTTATESTQLTPKQKVFVAEYVVCRNGAEAARRAKYSEKTARQMAAENLTKPVIQAAIEAKQRDLAQEYELDKRGVITELLDAVAVAKNNLDAGNMIRAWLEIAKILGINTPEIQKIEIKAGNEALRAQYEAMSDDQLLSIAYSSGH